ncbi:hypothetical protein C8J56DRAFT_773248 [Mycena floridula]|nr:hypothetical protein C8J56DRAFT_773248 [Mycena floridula]
MPEYCDSENSESLTELISSSKIILRQAVDVLDRHLINDDLLTTQSKFLPGSTIGKHLRHARDHFELLIQSICSPPPYTFSYDTRSRNTPMESSREAARKALLQTIERLEQELPAVDPKTPMTLQAVTPYLQAFDTTFGRELWFSALHCIHHWSMVRVIAGEQGITLSDDFGFAPSTLVYHGENILSPALRLNPLTPF